MSLSKLFNFSNKTWNDFPTILLHLTSEELFKPVGVHFFFSPVDAAVLIFEIEIIVHAPMSVMSHAFLCLRVYSFYKAMIDSCCSSKLLQ